MTLYQLLGLHQELSEIQDEEIGNIAGTVNLTPERVRIILETILTALSELWEGLDTVSVRGKGTSFWQAVLVALLRRMMSDHTTTGE